MATLTENLNYVLFKYWEEHWDPRSKDFLIAKGGPLGILAAMAFYVYFSLKLGPDLMRNRKPFALRREMLLYNIVTVALNGYFFLCSLYYLDFGLELLTNFKFPDQNNITELDMRKTELVHLYWWTKIFDLIDTVFFVLRKKDNQISGLHLYHHAVVPIFAWVAFKIAPTASCLGLFPLCNTFVHVVMYSYYALSALGPSVQPYLWWKKYITQLQLAQFVIYGLYVIPFLKYQEGYPLKFWLYAIGPQPILFFYLFYSFYRKSYKSKKEKLAAVPAMNGKKEL